MKLIKNFLQPDDLTLSPKASLDNIGQMEVNSAVLFHEIFDIFLVTYFASEITTASDDLSYRLFESNWINQTLSCKKLVLIVGEVLKQPLQLVIWVYPMNLQTFTSVSRVGAPVTTTVTIRALKDDIEWYDNVHERDETMAP